VLVVLRLAISLLIIGGYAGSIVRGALEASGVLGMLESPLIGLGEEER
jgi:hypothetical protein